MYNIDIELWTFRMQSEHSTTELRAPRSMLHHMILLTNY